MTDFSSPMRDKIVALYGASMLKRSVISIRGGAGVLTELLSGGRYKHVLEIGTYRGVGAAEMAQYVERVTTIDLTHGRMEQLGEKHDRRAFWASLGLTNIDFHAVRNNVQKERLVNSLDFDFALIDGAHDATVADDFALVKRCGAVLFHDFDPRGIVAQDHVFNFVSSLPPEQLTPMDIFCLWRAP